MQMQPQKNKKPRHCLGLKPENSRDFSGFLLCVVFILFFVCVMSGLKFYRICDIIYVILRKEGAVMKYIIGGLSLFLIPIIVNGVRVFLRQPKKAEKGKVYLPKFFAVLGFIIVSVFLIPTLITAFSDEPVWVPILYFVFTLLGATLIIAFINSEISYDEDGFVAKNFFGMKRKFTYDQITAIKENMHGDYIYIGKRKVMIDEFSVGGIDFIAFVNKKYRKLHNGQNLPKIRKTKHDLFNGNIDDAAGFIAAYILIGVAAAAFLSFTVWYVYFTPSSVENTTKRQVTFSSCAVQEDELILKSNDNTTYIIQFIDEGLSVENFESICNGTTVVTTYSNVVKPEDTDDFYSVKAILYNDNYLLSFEETNRYHQQEYFPLVILAGALDLIWITYVVASIVVGRNPKKYNRKIIKLFFRDGYVKY